MNIDGYEPLVTLGTLFNLLCGVQWAKVSISVRDKGNSTFPKALEKTCQLSFTTKLTGKATGLCFSISKDIVKAHGVVPITIGMKVETVEGESSYLIINLSQRQ